MRSPAHQPPSCQGTYDFLGHLGKAFFLVMQIFILCLAGAGLAACRHEVSDVLQSGQMISLGGWRGRWAGPVVPTAEGCGATTTGLMTIGSGTFAFDPFQGSTVINGTLADDGTLSGTLSRPIGQQQTASISLSARAQQDAAGDQEVAGRLVSGRCTWNVNLKRS